MQFCLTKWLHAIPCSPDLSAYLHCWLQQGVKERHKVGRPIAYRYVCGCVQLPALLLTLHRYKAVCSNLYRLSLLPRCRGDPNAATLTEQERRKIKRQISNRESARRVRQSRQKYVEELQLEVRLIAGTLLSGPEPGTVYAGT